MKNEMNATVKKVYDYPKYYEIAFSFRNIAKEVDVFEQLIQRYSNVKVENILEIGCGNSPHMLEIMRRGYTYLGIDINYEMVLFSRNKIRPLSNTSKIYCKDMRTFSLKESVDFVFIALGSLYVENTSELHSHFNSVTKALKSGGLYFMDWCLFFSPFGEHSKSWTMRNNGITVKTDVNITSVNKVMQTFEERLALSIDDHGDKIELSEKSIRRLFFPQEFLFFIENRKDFEFIGWWNDWNLEKPLIGTEEISRPILVIRKK